MLVQLRHIFKVYSGSTPESGKGFYWDGDIPWVTPEDVTQLNVEYRLRNTNRKITEEGYQNTGVTMVPENSIVLTKRAPIGHLAILDISACCNQGCFLLVPKHEVIPEFYYYVLLNNKYNLQILGRGSTFMELSLDDLKSFQIPKLSVQTQRKIVDYLKYETNRLDSLIKAKEQLVLALAEKRKTLIIHIVTKGLKPNVKMKNSGIEWLGEVPMDWTVKKIKYLSNLRSGDFITADSINDSDIYPVYGGNGLRGYTSTMTHSGEYVLIGRQGALCGNINYAKGDFWASEHAIVCSPLNNYSTYWFGELLRIMNLNQYSIAAAQPGLSVEVIKNLLIPVPSFREQEEISAYLMKNIANIDALMQATQESIELLRERRMAAINTTLTNL